MREITAILHDMLEEISNTFHVWYSETWNEKTFQVHFVYLTVCNVYLLQVQICWET